MDRAPRAECRRRGWWRALGGSALFSALVAIVVSIAWSDGTDPTVLVISVIAIVTVAVIAVGGSRRRPDTRGSTSRRHRSRRAPR